MIDTGLVHRLQTEQTTTGVNRETSRPGDWSKAFAPATPPVRPPAEVLVERYVDRAMLRALTTWLPDDELWFAEIPLWFAKTPSVEGVWAADLTVKGSLDKLASVLKAWVEWKIDDRDGDIPIIDGVDLNIL